MAISLPYGILGVSTANTIIPNYDNFNSGILDSGMWTATGSGDTARVLTQNGRLEITHTATAQYNAAYGTKSQDKTGSYDSVQIIDAGDMGITSHEVGINWSLDGNNQVWIFIGLNLIKCFKLVASVQTQVGSNLAYSSGTHKYLRLRESGGTIFFDWSTDGVTWTNQTSLVNPLGTTSLKVRLYSQCWQAEASGSYGYFDNYYSTSTASDLKTFTTDSGRVSNIVMFYQHWGDTDGTQNFVNSYMNEIVAKGAYPMITWEPWVAAGGTTQPTYSLANIIAGNFDSYISTFASACATWGKPMFLRIAHEMNGNWYPWSEQVNGNSAGQYASMWQRVKGLFTVAGATNVTFVWSPNSEYTGSTALSGLYPGDSYVDWVGMDCYNWGTNSGHTWQSFSAVVGTTYSNILALTSKPMMLTEVSCAETGGTKSTWIQTFLNTELASYPAIKGFIWFNNNNTPDWRIESSSTAQEAFKQSLTYWLTKGKPSNAGRNLSVNNGMSRSEVAN